MARRRLGYALLLLAAVAFYVFSPGYLSFYALVTLVLLPFLSLLLALPALWGLRVELEAGAGQVPRGGAACVRASARRSALLGGELALRWQAENLLHPQFTQGGSALLEPGGTLELPLECGWCGWVRCRLTRCRVRDWMGLWSLPVKPPVPALVLVRPVPDSSALPDLDQTAVGVRLAPRPGGGPGEEYDLRDYRPGDPVNAIHWKLTAKRPQEEAPVLRETLEPLRETLLVCYDHFGPPDEVDRALGRLDALAQALLERERPFLLQDPREAAPHAVSCAPEWEKCLRALCAQLAPVDGAGAPPVPSFRRGGPIRVLQVSGKEQGVAP